MWTKGVRQSGFWCPNPPIIGFGTTRTTRNRQCIELSPLKTKPTCLRVSQTAQPDEAPRPPETDSKNRKASFHGTSIGPIFNKGFSMVCKLKSVHSNTQRQYPTWFGQFCSIKDGNCALEKRALNLHKLSAFFSFSPTGSKTGRPPRPKWCRFHDR